MDEYTVKVRDHNQDITHTLRQLAHSQNEANAIVMDSLRKMLGHNQLEII